MRAGERIDRYELVAEIGRGGFGSIWRARHSVLGTEVALKVLLPNRAASSDVVERFLREARIVAGIVSPHVVRVVDAGQATPSSGGPPQIFLALELLDGEDLDARLQRDRSLPVAEAVRLAREIALGLEAAHGKGVIHRDLKPQNVFLARHQDGSVVAKILDFGISKSHVPGHTEPAITQTGAVLGTPTYMAPEQLMGSRQIDARADLYALSVTLYEMLSDRLPYEAETLDRLIAMRLTEPPTPLAAAAPHLPGALVQIVQRGLADDPLQRWPSARAYADALGSLGDLTQGSARTGPVGPVPELAAVARPAGAGLAMASTAMASDSAELARGHTGPLHGASKGGSAAPVDTPSPSASVPPAAGSLPPLAAAHSAAPGTLPPPPVGRVFRGLAIASAVGCVAVVAGGLAMIAAALLAAGASQSLAPEATPAPAPAAAEGAASPAPTSPAPTSPAPDSVAAAPSASPSQVPTPSPAAPPAPAAAPSPEPAPDEDAPSAAPATSAARAYIVTALGAGPEAAGEAFVRRASIGHCARPGTRDHVRVQVMFGMDGEIAICQPDPNVPHGEESVARCVASALRRAGPLETSEVGGILVVEADL